MKQNKKEILVALRFNNDKGYYDAAYKVWNEKSVVFGNGKYTGKSSGEAYVGALVDIINRTQASEFIIRPSDDIQYITLNVCRGGKKAYKNRMDKALRGRTWSMIEAVADMLPEVEALIGKEEERDEYVCYTDGSCNNLSPYGEAGAAYVVVKDGVIVAENSKGFLDKTNNFAELVAIVSAVNAVPKGAKCIVRTDSKYCIDFLYNRNPIYTSNLDVRKVYDKCAKGKKVTFEWIKGHNGDYYNELVDERADARRAEMRERYNIPVYSAKNSPKVNYIPQTTASPVDDAANAFNGCNAMENLCKRLFVD